MSICKHCGRDEADGHWKPLSAISSQSICPTSLFAASDEPPPIKPPDPPDPPPLGMIVFNWDWNSNPAPIWHETLFDNALAIQFVPLPAGGVGSSTANPDYIDPDFPQGYPMQVSISDLAGDFSKPPLWTREGSSIQFVVDVQQGAYTGPLVSGHTYFLNYRLTTPAGRDKQLRFEPRRPY